MAFLFQEHENAATERKYPFAGSSDLTDANGVELRSRLFTDAVLYPEEGLCRLVSIESDGELCSVTVESDSGTLSGCFGVDSATCELYDSTGVHRGTIVLGSDKVEAVYDTAAHVYSGADFCASCQHPLGSHGVTSLHVGDNSLTGDVSFVQDDSGISSVVPVLSEPNPDGSRDLRFDVLPNSGILKTDKTGIRKIHILREPDSRFGVIDVDGRPYLFLTKNGEFSQSALISREDICNHVSGSVGAEDYATRSAHDVCGGSKSSASVCKCIPSYIYDKDWYLSGNNSDHFDIPADNRYADTSTFSVFFLEGNLYSEPVVNPYGVYAVITSEFTRSARYLFEEQAGDQFVLDLKADKYGDFYQYVHDIHENARGSDRGYLDMQSLSDICAEKGWLLPDNPQEINQDEARQRLVDGGLTGRKHLYTIRARDFFDHYECRNWEVAENPVKEVKSLVSWGEGDDYMNGGNSYVTVSGVDGNVSVPRWIVSRYVWWKKYSKNESTKQPRFFIVPEERGVVVYTGNYWVDGNKDVGWKEKSFVSSTCPYFVAKKAGANQWDSRYPWPVDGWMNNPVMKERLHEVFAEDYDPTYGDDVFYGRYDWNTDSRTKISVDPNSLDNIVPVKDIPDPVEVIQPYDTPVFTTSKSSGAFVCGFYKGPFAYEYDRLYLLGVGYPEDEEDVKAEEAAEAIKAPVVFTFDITRASGNSFDFDVTDLTALADDGVSYSNPIHVTVAGIQDVVRSLDVSDPTDVSEVSSELRKITGRSTSGNGISIGIPGLEVGNG